MGRPREGWTLRPPKPGRKYFTVRFTHDGRQVEPSTGESDPVRAAERAAEIYARATSGAGEPVQRRRAPALVGRPLGEVGASWLSEVDGTTLDPETAKTYGLYLSTHLGPFFGELELVTTERAKEYLSERLRKVKGSTVRKELSCLRGLLAWAHARGLLPSAPALPSVPKRTPGTAHPRGKRTHTELSPAEVRKLLAALPERSKHGWPVRARFVVAYETTLRPATLDALSVPEHYTKGARYLRLEAVNDKGRYERMVPLTRAAQRALSSVCPEAGPIFGRHDYRDALEKAARSALSKDKAATFFGYELRGAGITHLLEETGNMPGVQYLAGHKHASTTALYVRASLRAAEQVVSGARKRRP